MTYEQARQYIETMSKTGIVLGLDSIRNLLNELGNPQDDLKFVHIAGTNGKGSTLAFISTILEVAGYKVGRYVSPTVQSYRERIQINRTNISQVDFATSLSKIKKAVESLQEKGLPQPSVFEIETALGFLFFKEQNCDIVVMETGMGGLTDATNVIKNTLVAVITSVSRDHMEFLGDTIADLTQAKVGIIKPDSHVVHGELPTESFEIVQRFENKTLILDKNDLIIRKSRKKYTQIFNYQNMQNLEINLLGRHQIENACLAVLAIQSLQEQGFVITDNHIKQGLAATEWFARITVVKEKNPTVIVDGAHNQDSVRKLAETLAELFPSEQIVGVMGVFKDKEIVEMLAEIKPVMSKIHTITLPDANRTMQADELAKLVVANGIEAESHNSLESALNTATTEAEVVVAFGSFSYLKAVLEYIC